MSVESAASKSSAFSSSSANCISSSATAVLSMTFVQAMLKDEPGMRNSNLLPVNAKGDVRLRSELSCGICGRLVTPISMLLCPAAL